MFLKIPTKILIEKAGMQGLSSMNPPRRSSKKMFAYISEHFKTKKKLIKKKNCDEKTAKNYRNCFELKT